MSKTANEKILALANPEYVEKIPSFIRSHAMERTCGVIEREFGALYQEFEKDPVGEEAKEQMKLVVNDIFAEHMKKHRML